VTRRYFLGPGKGRHPPAPPRQEQQYLGPAQAAVRRSNGGLEGHIGAGPRPPPPGAWSPEQSSPRGPTRQLTEPPGRRQPRRAPSPSLVQTPESGPAPPPVRLPWATWPCK
ncbi:unnamed protein product, partial [Gulo gulo]